MQKKENILGEAGEALGGGALGPGVALVTFGLFLLQGGRPGRRFAGADDDDPTAARVVLFLLPRGGRDPAAPTESQGQDGTHLRQPCGKVGRKETLDGKEDDAAEEESV
jgi:hypothetical protein